MCGGREVGFGIFKEMKVGLFFGSFNPIHIGHVAIAKFMAEETDLDQVWLVVSPHNPLKDKKSLGDARKRLQVVKKAIGRNPGIKVSDIEFKLPQPSYTIHTLRALKGKYPQHKFVLIIGEDNLAGLSKWKDYRKILAAHSVYVYPRFDSASSGLRHSKNVTVFNAPQIDVSSTFIRKEIRKGKNINHLIPTKVRNVAV